MPLELKYFVLKPHGTDEYAIASRKAMLAYADSIADTDPDFATDLSLWVEREEVSDG